MIAANVAAHARRRSFGVDHARLAAGLVSMWLLLSALALAALVMVPVVFAGWKAESVASGSMAPAIGRGDVVLTAHPPHARLAPGTVITFKRGDETITHRIVAVRADGSYVTRGDANKVDDSTPVPPSSIVGVVHVVVPYVGLPREWARTHDFLPLLLVVVLVVLLSAAAADVLAHPVVRLSRLRLKRATS